jgi:hypothetical protein
MEQAYQYNARILHCTALHCAVAEYKYQVFLQIQIPLPLAAVSYHSETNGKQIFKLLRGIFNG